MARGVAAGSATRRVHDWTRSRVLDGTYPGGMMLSEGEVAAAVGVSRTPVREAFLQLEAEGMLALYPKRGALVMTVSTIELRDVLSARLLIEPWAASRVAAGADRAGVVAELRRWTAEAVDAIGAGRHEQFQEADRAFHLHLMHAAGNELLAAFHSSLRDRQIRGGSLALQHQPDRARTAMDQHLRIVAAVEAGDADAAAAGAAGHINDTAAALGIRLD